MYLLKVMRWLMYKVKTKKSGGAPGFFCLVYGSGYFFKPISISRSLRYSPAEMGA